LRRLANGLSWTTWAFLIPSAKMLFRKEIHDLIRSSGRVFPLSCAVIGRVAGQSADSWLKVRRCGVKVRSEADKHTKNSIEHRGVQLRRNRVGWSHFSAGTFAAARWRSRSSSAKRQSTACRIAGRSLARALSVISVCFRLGMLSILPSCSSTRATAS